MRRHGKRDLHEVTLAGSLPYLAQARARYGSRCPTADSSPRTRSSSPPPRVTQTRDLGLETVGLTPGDRLTVDDPFRVTGIRGGRLYAVGDVGGHADVPGNVVSGRVGPYISAEQPLRDKTLFR